MRLTVACVLLAVSDALRCKICVHMGTLSIVPEYAPRSLMVFDVHRPNCTEKIIHCASNENRCFSGVATVSAGLYWVHKGCVPHQSSDWPLINKRRDSFCTDDYIDSWRSRHFPQPMDSRTAEMRVCLCLGDLCNATPNGLVAQHRPEPDTAGQNNATIVLIMISNALLLLLSQLL